jgi:predicted RecA/RadA family phage recombinase
MATNITYNPGDRLNVVCSHPASPTTGAPVRYGEMTGIALTDEGEGGNISTETTVDFGPFVANLSVKGIDGSGNSAVAVGDKLYYTDADTPPISKKSTGRFFGYALGAVTSSGTATVAVKHAPM